MDKLIFQITDLQSDDLWFRDTSQNVQKFVITLYGIDQNGNNVVCNVLNYYPAFYIKLPDLWKEEDGRNLVKDICKRGKVSYKTTVKSVVETVSKDFYKFYRDEDTGTEKKFKYLKVSCRNYGNMKKLIKSVKDVYHDIELKEGYRFAEWINLETQNCDSNLYESFIHPIIRFIHESDIKPTGWVEANVDDKYTTDLFDNEEYSCSWENISKYETLEMSKFIVASYDIECDSSHGDFPLAKKDMRKLAQSIYDIYREYIKNIPSSFMDMFMQKDRYVLIHEIILKSFRMKDNDRYKIVRDIDICEIYTKGGQPTKSKIKDISIELMNNERIINKLMGDSKESDECVKLMIKKLRGLGVEIEGDKIIQIGTVFYKYGTDEEYERVMIVMGPDEDMKVEDICDDIDGIVVIRCKTEKELLLEWVNLMNSRDPDFVTGYNVFGFDYKFICDRVDECIECHKKCSKWGHNIECKKCNYFNLGKINNTHANSLNHKNKRCMRIDQELTSSGLGENHLTYIRMDGRILFDLQKEIQKSHNLESYKLDNVAAHFMRGKIKSINKDIIKTHVGFVKKGDYISFRIYSNIGEELYQEGKKYMVKDINVDSFQMDESLNIDCSDYLKVEWCLNKDDIEPHDIFNYHKYGNSSDRAQVAKYCIQDCELCINILISLDIITNNLAMADVSFVPASYIFLRGQGVKVTSVVSKLCLAKNVRMPELVKPPKLRKYVALKKSGETDEIIRKIIIKDLTKNEKNYRVEDKTEDEIAEGGEAWRRPKNYELDNWMDEIRNPDEYKMAGFEGAVVLDPKPDIYLDDPVAVLDYASLYPSSIIEKNLSPETNVEYEKDIDIIGYENLNKIEYDNFMYIGKGKGDTVEKIIDKDNPIKTCYFLKPEYMKQMGMDRMGIIPQVLEHLLDARTATKVKMKKETDDFKKKVLDGVQLAYKITANSVYGQLGASTSTIYKMNIAACTTSIGRQRIDDASNGVKDWAKKKGYEEPDIVYGDTDSVFVKFSRIKQNRLLEGKEALEHCIKCGIEAGDYISKGELILDDKIVKSKPLLNKPQDLEYEKTFWPFILISKKRYTGDKYEYNSDDCKRTSMGIVLKRRDNAPIVKYVFGNIIEKIMIERNFDETIIWLKHTLTRIRNGEFPLRYFVITKALRGNYKNPTAQPHKVLADRIAVRDPGNKPKVNDRIPFAYIKLRDDVLYDKNNPYKSGARKGKPRARNILQGDRAEHVDFIRQNNLALDYEFYITNQIMNPVKQVLDLKLDPLETEKIFITM